MSKTSRRAPPAAPRTASPPTFALPLSAGVLFQIKQGHLLEGRRRGLRAAIPPLLVAGRTRFALLLSSLGTRSSPAAAAATPASPAPARCLALRLSIAFAIALRIAFTATFGRRGVVRLRPLYGPILSLRRPGLALGQRRKFVTPAPPAANLEQLMPWSQRRQSIVRDW